MVSTTIQSWSLTIRYDLTVRAGAAGEDATEQWRVAHYSDPLACGTIPETLRFDEPDERVHNAGSSASHPGRIIRPVWLYIEDHAAFAGLLKGGGLARLMLKAICLSWLREIRSSASGNERVLSENGDNSVT